MRIPIFIQLDVKRPKLDHCAEFESEIVTVEQNLKENWQTYLSEFAVQPRVL